MRGIERAIRRARVPVAYSQGFNPSMKLSYGPPLPLGFTSESEFVDITLEANLMPHMIECLNETMPQGMHILEAKTVFGKPRSLSASLNRAVYTLELGAIEEAVDVPARIGELLAKDVLEIERAGKVETKVVDVRPAIYDLRIEGGVLVMVLGIGEGGYVRPTELAAMLFDAHKTSIAAMPFHRKDMYRQETGGQIVKAIDL